jgi:hypothetical protein
MSVAWAARENKRKKDLHEAAGDEMFGQEGVTAVVAGVVAIACLIAGASVVNSSSAGGGILIVIAVIIAARTGYWKWNLRHRMHKYTDSWEDKP